MKGHAAIESEIIRMSKDAAVVISFSFVLSIVVQKDLARAIDIQIYYY